MEGMSEIQASPLLGEVEVRDCGIWSFSFSVFDVLVHWTESL